ncbi:RNA helicase [Saccharomycopsis crataegensis]|uniref:RNA helicase n=1 Tax=Saccharomycopsis crataegensis TaxID=43959 RepID=A0AAV5QR70_9ASCO|nr:RNA helicase [Saccharomycopsis crataegensis]
MSELAESNNHIVQSLDGEKKKKKRKRKKSKNANIPVVEDKLEDPEPLAQNKKTKFDNVNVKAEEEFVEPSVVTNTPLKEDTTAEAKLENQKVSPKPKNQKRPRSINKERKDTKNVSYFTDDEDEDVNQEIGPTDWKSLQNRADKLLEIRKTLPVYKSKDKHMEHLIKNKVTVLIGETGSGKSTQIPQFLIPHNKKAIAVTQPRRVAAINLATRVAEEYGSKIGDKVGYSVRFDNKSHKNTKLKYLTDGMLLRELMMKSDLSQYSTIIIDEAHERTILTDLLMGFLKELLLKRQEDKDFKIIIMSATLDAEKFSHFFNDCEILYVEGKMYPVERFYLDTKSEDIIDTTINTVIQINQGEEEGDVLVFLAGQEEIDKACSALQMFSPLLPKEAPIIVPLPLYAALPPAQQMKVFQPVKKNQRKIILATNIAETSLTVPGVRYVIDSGLRKVKVWRHQLGLSTLLTVPISQASATQRSGRAGRERNGKAFRLFTESDYHNLPKQTEPEIIRTDIAHSILMLKKLKVKDIVNWSWIEHPGQDSLFSALNQLYSLKALDDNGDITELGEQMAVLPVSPHLSTVLINAHKLNCLGPVIDIIACLNVENLILNPPSDKRDEINEKRRQICTLGNKYGDLLMFKELLDYFIAINSTGDKKKWCKEFYFNFRGFKNVLQIRDQLTQYMKSLFGADIENNDDDNDYFAPSDDEDLINESEMKSSKRSNNKPLGIESILKSFLQGFVMNSAIGYPDRSYRTVFSGQLISIHPSSLLFGKKCEGIMYTEFVYTTKGYARNVSMIDPEWLKEIAPHILGNREAINDN